MKSIFLPTLLFLSSLAATLTLSSCTPNNRGGSAGDGTYTAPAPLSSVDATDRMRSEFREIR